MSSRILEASMVFNKNTVNFFTDASVKDTTVIAGVEGISLYDDIPDISKYKKLTNSTNNEGEIYAIYMALNMCVHIKNTHGLPFIFNIFSDSKISIFGLRKWYEEWLKKEEALENHVLMNSSGKKVANQQIFLRCFNVITRNKLCVNFYHINAHINPNNKSDYMRFVDDFTSANDLDGLPSRELVERLVYMNDKVDRKSRQFLSDGCDNAAGKFLFNLDSFSIAKERKRYTELINNIKKES